MTDMDRPCPRWSLQQPHETHDFEHPDGHAVWPGWPIQGAPCRQSADCVRFDGCPSCRSEDYAW